eukprot:gene15186-biopygen635
MAVALTRDKLHKISGRQHSSLCQKSTCTLEGCSWGKEGGRGAPLQDLQNWCGAQTGASPGRERCEVKSSQLWLREQQCCRVDLRSMHTGHGESDQWWSHRRPKQTRTVGRLSRFMHAGRCVVGMFAKCVECQNRVWHGLSA